SELMAFFGQRLEPMLSGRGYSFDLVQSVIERAAAVPMKDLIARLDAIREFKSHEKYNDFLIGFKRVRNITPDENLPGIDPSLFTVEEEKALYSAYEKTGESVIERGNDYNAAIGELVALVDPINKFFDGVLVMDKDEKVKMNRLSLLKGLWELASGVADFSKLQETEG
ncbi:MAG: hypothetical protein GWN86_31680, partial [Desulfobacterales bacterium]|nr:hypothetical protein [Desulfobacterales bacterium]